MQKPYRAAVMKLPKSALVLNGKNAAEHTVLIKVKEPGKKFTITAISVK